MLFVKFSDFVNVGRCGLLIVQHLENRCRVVLLGCEGILRLAFPFLDRGDDVEYFHSNFNEEC